MPVSDNLKRKRKQARLTQIQLAEKSGVSQQAISFIESGRNTPSEGTMRLLASALNCTISELLDEAQPAEGSEITEYERQLLTLVRQLNRQGQDKLLDYARDLSENERYKKGTQPAKMAE